MERNIIRPTENSTEQEIRDFVIAILGGDREDTEQLQDVDRLRFDFGACNSGHNNIDVYTHNMNIINILNNWGLLNNAKYFAISVWKGSLNLNFNLEKGLEVGQSNFDYNRDNVDGYPFDYSFYPIPLNIDTTYNIDCTSHGTVGIITNVIRAITFAKVKK